MSRENEETRAMSQQNVEVVRRWIESLGTPNPVSSHADDARICNYTADSSPLELDGAEYEGPSAPERWWRDLSEPFDKIRLRLDRDPIAVDHERVLAVHHFEARFAHTQLEGPSPPWASIHKLRDGRIVESVGYASVEHAFEAAGLSR